MSTLKTPYFAILTTIGMAKLAKAVTKNTTLSLTHLGVGDGEGPQGAPSPSPDQKQLIHECRRAPINALTMDPNSPHQIIAEQIIPASEGGWWIREIGLYDEDGDLCAVANCAPSYKPKLEEGSGREMVLRMILALSNTKAVKLLIDPGVVLATRKHVEESVQKVVDVLHTDYALLRSPAFTGEPIAPTPPEEDSSTRISTTAFVQGHAFSHVQWRIFTENGIFTVPDGVHRIWISACAGGGGGGGGGSSGNQDTLGYGGGGGGGGGAGESVLYARHEVKPKDIVSIVIGQRGKGGAALALTMEDSAAKSSMMVSNGTSGGDTHIGNLLHLKGGQGGGAGGVLTTQAGPGGPGGQGWPMGSAGGDGAFAGNGGPGASSPFGGGGGAGRSSTVTHAIQNGAPAAGYGSGGGGAGSAYQYVSRRGGEGGSGAPGLVRIEW